MLFGRCDFRFNRFGDGIRERKRDGIKFGQFFVIFNFRTQRDRTIWTVEAHFTAVNKSRDYICPQNFTSAFGKVDLLRNFVKFKIARLNRNIINQDKILRCLFR